MAGAPVTGSKLQSIRHLCSSRGSRLLLVSIFIILPVLVSDNVRAFRIRDGNNLASSEQTRSSCNPLLGKCPNKILITSGNNAANPGNVVRARLDGVSLSASRGVAAKIQPPVGKIDDDKATKVDGGKIDGTGRHTLVETARTTLRSSDVPKIGIRRTGSHDVEMNISPNGSEDEDDEGDVGVEADEDTEEDEEMEDDVEEDEDDDDDEDAEEDDDSRASQEIDEDRDEGEELGTESDENDGRSEIGDAMKEDDGEDEENEDDSEDVESNGSETVAVEDNLSRDRPETRSVERVRRGYEKRMKDSSQDVKESREVDERKVEEETNREVEMETGASTQLSGVAGEQHQVVEEPREIFEESQTGIQGETMDSARGGESVLKSKDIDVSERSRDGNDSEMRVATSVKKLDRVRHAEKMISVKTDGQKSSEKHAENVEIRKNEGVEQSKKSERPESLSRNVDKAPREVSAKRDENGNAAVNKENRKKVSVKVSEDAPQPKKEGKSHQGKQQKQPQKTEIPKTEVPQRKTTRQSERAKPKQTKKGEAAVSLQELNDLLLHVPTFTPNFTAIGNPLCEQHGKIFLRQLRGYKLWALQMLDSSAKIPSGILRGNINQLGDFDQCLGVKAHVKVEEKTVKIQGKYCLATIDLQATWPDMKVPVNLMQSRAFIRSNMNEPGHFIPKFTTVNWALCVPAACTAADVKFVMENALKTYNGSTGLKITVDVDADSCYVKQKQQSYSKETVAVLYFYAMTVCLVLVATLRDYCVTSDGEGTYSERIIMAFSLRRTMKTLFRDTKDVGDIPCIHGIRTLATILLYVAHKLMPLARMPFANRISLTEVSNSPLSSLLRVSLVYTDSFLLLSGVLTAYNMAKEYNDRGEIRWFCRFVTRFVRLTPALLAVVFWYAFVMEHIGSGPQWNSVIKTNADLCKKNAWTNLLYIQNFFPFEEMCATHTHQLALDMQLSIIAPVVVFFFYCKPVVGMLIVFFLLQLSATLRYAATSNNFLSIVIFHGMTLKHLYKTANLTYALPLHRATPYLFGVTLGVVMRHTGKEVRIPKVFVVVGWLTATILACWSLFSPWRLARRDYTYNVEEATYLAVVLPVFWATSICWVIFASFTEHGGFINRFLSSYWMVVFSRISYAVYLTQFAVFFYNAGSIRYASEFQIYRVIDVFEGGMIIGVSIMLTLILDLPMQQIRNVMMQCTDVGVVAKVSGREEDAVGKEKVEGNITTPVDNRNGKQSGIEANAKPVNREQDQEQNIIRGEKMSVAWKAYIDDEETLASWKYRREDDRFRPNLRRDVKEQDVPTWVWLNNSSLKSSRGEVEGDVDLDGDRRNRGRRGMSSNDFVADPRTPKKSTVLSARDEELLRRDRRSQSRISDTKRTSARSDEDNGYKEYEVWDRPSSKSGTRTYAASDTEPRESSRKERSVGRDEEIVVIPFAKAANEQPSTGTVRKERSISHSIDGRVAPNRNLEGQTSAPKLTTGSLSRLNDYKMRSPEKSETDEAEITDRRKQETIDGAKSRENENWNHGVRLRRQRISQSEPCEEVGTVSDEEEWNVLRRRSSAEGKMALLNDTTDIRHTGTWDLSRTTKKPHAREVSESEEENPHRRDEYRETNPPFRDDYETQSEEESSWEPSRRHSFTSGSLQTSVDEEDVSSGYDYVLRKPSKRRSLQNLSRLPTENEESGLEETSEWDFVRENNCSLNPMRLSKSSTGLFKRASIIKSQASEEDPEYLLPERPKLIEQEQEHPFKKAWQMQKSRSEEDGSVGYLVKEVKTSLGETLEERTDTSQVENSGTRKLAGGRNEDLSYFAGDEAETTSVSHPPSTSGESANLDWVEDDKESEPSFSEYTEELTNAKKGEDNGDPKYDDAMSAGEPDRHSRESNWEWDQEET